MSEAVDVLTVALADDEPPARRLLEEYLDGLPGVRLVAACGSGREIVAAVESRHPDLLLLDVQMPGLDGFEVLELLERPPAVIFTTAYEEYALKAFEVHAVDYLLKPFSAERLASAIERARERIARGVTQPLAELTAWHRARSRPLERVLVREGSRIHVLPVAEIVLIEAQDDYIRLRHAGRMLRKKQTLSEIAELLDPRRFVRTHRSYLLNVEFLASLELYAKDSRVAVLRDGERVPVSRAGYARLRKLL